VNFVEWPVLGLDVKIFTGFTHGKSCASCSKKIPIAACVLQLSQKICCPFVLLLLETEQESAIVALLVPLMLAYFVISF
jgi:hypothetical protein